MGGVQSTAVTARLLLGLLLSTTSHVAVDAAGVAALRPSTDMQLSTAATNARPVKSPFAALVSSKPPTAPLGPPSPQALVDMISGLC